MKTTVRCPSAIDRIYVHVPYDSLECRYHYVYRHSRRKYHGLDLEPESNRKLDSRLLPTNFLTHFLPSVASLANR